MHSKRILITGAAGFIGSHLVRRLLHDGCHVVALVRPSSDLWRLQDILDKIELHYSDLRDFDIDVLKSKIFDIQIVYHLGASGVNPSEKDFYSLMQANVMGTFCLLQLASYLKVERFVYCGSCSEYGSGNSLMEDAPPRPVTEYGVSKASAWMLVNTFCHQYGLPVVSLRPFTVYGPFEAHYRLVPHVIMNILEGMDIELTGGKQKRDMVFIDDVVEAFRAAGTVPGIIGDTLNVSTGWELSVKEIVLTIVELMGSPVKPLFGARPYREFELWSLSGDPSKAKDKLGWSAQISLKEGLWKTIEWFKTNRAKYSVYVNS